MLTPAIIPAFSKPATPSSRLVVVVGDDRALVSLMDQLFKQSGLTQVELAERLGVRKQTINQYLNYRRCNPSVLWLMRFAEACGGRLIMEIPS